MLDSIIILLSRHVLPTCAFVGCSPHVLASEALLPGGCFEVLAALQKVVKCCVVKSEMVSQVIAHFLVTSGLLVLLLPA